MFLQRNSPWISIVFPHLCCMYVPYCANLGQPLWIATLGGQPAAVTLDLDPWPGTEICKGEMTHKGWIWDIHLVDTTYKDGEFWGYLYLYLYLYLYIYISISISIYIYIYIYISISIFLYLYIYIYISISIFLYLYIYIYISISIYLYLYFYIYNYIRRKFRSQTSDNMQRWNSRGGKSQDGEVKKWEDKRWRKSEERRCRCAKR